MNDDDTKKNAEVWLDEFQRMHPIMMTVWGEINRILEDKFPGKKSPVCSDVIMVRVLSFCGFIRSKNFSHEKAVFFLACAFDVAAVCHVITDAATEFLKSQNPAAVEMIKKSAHKIADEIISQIEERKSND